MDGALSPELPTKRTIGGAEAIQMLVIRANQQPISDDDGRRFDLAVCLEGPDGAAVTRAHSVNGSVQVADVDHAVCDAGRRLADRTRRFVLPTQGTVGQVE